MNRSSHKKRKQQIKINENNAIEQENKSIYIHLEFEFIATHPIGSQSQSISVHFRNTIFQFHFAVGQFMILQDRTG